MFVKQFVSNVFFYNLFSWLSGPTIIPTTTFRLESFFSNHCHWPQLAHVRRVRSGGQGTTTHLNIFAHMGETRLSCNRSQKWHRHFFEICPKYAKWQPRRSPNYPKHPSGGREAASKAKHNFAKFGFFKPAILHFFCKCLHNSITCFPGFRDQP